MIYTIGNKNNYDKMLKPFLDDIGLEEDQTKFVYKLGKEDNYPGGSVFKTIRDAKNFLIKYQYDDYGIYGVNADWETDTEDCGKEFNNLLVNAQIVTIDLRYR